MSAANENSGKYIKMTEPAKEHSTVSEWFNGRNILITGATGFMGKVLVEKLLRSCPGVGNLYLIVRSKRGVRAEDRLNSIINVPLFDILRKTDPDAFRKIVIIKGDITAADLGLDEKDRDLILENVSVVFHSAATVKFDEALRSSVAMNIIGTQQLIKLSYKMQKLETFIHVSTAYCNCHLTEIDEEVYQSPYDLKKLTECVRCLDDDLLDDITLKILGNRPNTYTFTKAIAEQIVLEHSKSLPIAIFRPSIVTASWKEPFPGWVDTFNGPTGMIIGAGKGILKSIMSRRSAVADIIPVDVVINLLICVAWETANHRSDTLPVYNCVSGEVNPVIWGNLEKFGQRFVREYPQTGLMWYPCGQLQSSVVWHKLSCLLYHVLPAYIVDLCTYAAGRKPMMVKVQKKVAKAMKSVEYFTIREWKFKSTNVPKLLSRLSDADKKQFNVDISTLDWEDYMRNYTHGIRKFVLNDSDDTLPVARAHLKRMKYLHYAVQILFVLLLWKMFMDSSLLYDISILLLFGAYIILTNEFTR